MNQLRVTHLSRYREGWDAELGYDGWFIRFTGEQDDFDDMRDELKTWGRMYACWVPAYQWRDGKQGAWWIDEGLFNDTYLTRFERLQEAMDAIRDGDVLQWIGKRKPRTRTPKSKVPAYLFYDYLLLGVGSGATVQDVKRAYRQLSKVHHPDAGGSHDGFIKLQKSYERVMYYVEMNERIAV